jgi:hypothetical protein
VVDPVQRVLDVVPENGVLAAAQRVLLDAIRSLNLTEPAALKTGLLGTR